MGRPRKYPVDIAEKLCSRCGVIKPRDQFYVNKATGSLRAECRECTLAANKVHARKWDAKDKARKIAIQRDWYHKRGGKEHTRNYHLAKKYGITVEQYEAMLTAQLGVCALCETEEAGGHGGWHVDHDHATGRVRGLLCHPCNTALGLFRDDPELLRRAIAYLAKGNN